MGHGSIVTDWLTREQIDGVIQQLSGLPGALLKDTQRASDGPVLPRPDGPF